MASDDAFLRVDNLVPVVSIIGLVVLSFLGGTAVARYELFPYPQYLEPSFRAAEARLNRARAQTRVDPGESNAWVEPRTETRGVTRYDGDRAFYGYTLYSSKHRPAAHLIDMGGNRLHTWEKTFSDIWPEASHIRDPVDDEHVHWRDARLLPDGELLVNFTAAGADTPYGYGLAKLDRNSEVVWTFDDHNHHDITVLDDGTIWTLTQELRRFEDGEDDIVVPEQFEGIWLLDDHAVHLSADGEVLNRVPLGRSVVDKIGPKNLEVWHAGANWDLLHTNNIEPIDADFAEHHDFAEPGQLLLSFRSLDAIGLFDLDRRELVWFSRGFWHRQHDPDPLDDGNMLIFDNRGYSGPGGKSRVAEFDPSTDTIVWSYTGTGDDPFYTKKRGQQQRLPNGNLLITENRTGRIVEVTRDHEIVWEFYNPARAEDAGQRWVPKLGGITPRYAPEQLTFVD